MKTRPELSKFEYASIQILSGIFASTDPKDMANFIPEMCRLAEKAAERLLNNLGVFDMYGEDEED